MQSNNELISHIGFLSKGNGSIHLKLFRDIYFLFFDLLIDFFRLFLGLKEIISLFATGFSFLN